ncbi:7717_t:CDS:1, partial [Acaulospora colombiana]
STPDMPTAENLEDIPEQNSHVPHPVYVTVLISMPDATRPTHSNKKANQLQKSEFKEQNRIPLPSLTLGTTQPSVSLPSLRLRQEELDTWWDLPSYSPHNLYNTPRGIALGPGIGVAFNRFGVQMNPQLAYAMAHERRSREVERERAHRHYPVLLQDLRMSSTAGGR